MPGEYQEAIVPAAVDVLSKDFLKIIEHKVAGQVKIDGELLILWPDILQGAKNWREYRKGSSPVGKLDKNLRLGWERLFKAKNGFAITDEDREQFKKIRNVGPYIFSMVAAGGKLKHAKWLESAKVELDQPLGFSFADVVSEENAILYALELSEQSGILSPTPNRLKTIIP